MNAATVDPPLDPPLSALRSKADFEQALFWALQQALAVRARRLTWIDPDFQAWPLDDPALLELMTHWLRLPQRRLVLLAHQFGTLERAHPRFVAWRRDRAHAVDAWSPSEGVEAKLPTLLLDDDQICLHMVDTVHWRGRLSLDASSAHQWRDEIDVLLQRCEASFPVHHLGL
jgi:hypothetical protein